MAIKTYDDFYKFFGDFPRAYDLVYSESDNGHGKPGYRGKGYHVIIEKEEWDESYLKESVSVIFSSESGSYDNGINDWIVQLIIDEIAKIDNDFYFKLTDEEWFQKNINSDYACVQDLYSDYEYDEDKYFEDIQSGKYATYGDYIHYLAEDYVNELKEDLKNK